MMSLEVLLPETMFLGLALKCQSSNCSKIWWASKYKYCRLPSQLNKPNMLFLSLLAFKFHQEWIDKCESCFSSSFVAFKMNALYLFLIPLHIYQCTVPFSSFFSLKKKELNGWQFLFFFPRRCVHICTDGVFRSLDFLPKLLLSAVLHRKSLCFCNYILEKCRMVLLTMAESGSDGFKKVISTFFL